MTTCLTTLSQNHSNVGVGARTGYSAMKSGVPTALGAGLNPSSRMAIVGERSPTARGRTRTAPGQVPGPDSVLAGTRARRTCARGPRLAGVARARGARGAGEGAGAGAGSPQRERVCRPGDVLLRLTSSYFGYFGLLRAE